MRQPTFLEYGNYRYLKAAGILAGAALLAYAASSSAYGGTWLGYVLGIVSALLVLALTAYGVRRRITPNAPDRRPLNSSTAAAPPKHHRERRKIRTENHWRYGGSMQGWLSAHAYLGIALIVLSSLHTGFRFGWNIHTLAYALVLLVAASGLYGAYSYLHHPRQITRNLGEHTLDSLLLKIAELDELARMRALELPDEVNTLVATARQATPIGGSFLQRLGIGRPACPTELALRRVEELGRQLIDGDQPRLMRDMYSVLLQKQRLLVIAREGVKLDARMKLWLYLHAPLSVALLAALFSHVFVILVYW